VRRSVGIIGGGIFGLTAAVNLSDTHDVTVFEQSPDILTGATWANHNRHHYGYHYPRSPETAQQCLESRELFEGTYGDCCNRSFANYYCVAKEDTKTTPEDYVRFCDQVGLGWREEWPQGDILDRSRIALSLRTEEGVYDFATLKRLIGERLGRSRDVTLHLRHRVIDASIAAGGEKRLVVEDPDGGRREMQFDYLINAMYANYNRFCGWLGFEQKLFQYNLQELCVIDLPVNDPVGITIQDGPFPSFLPLGFSRNRCLFAHVEASQLVRDVSNGRTPLLNRVLNIQSNWSGVRDVSAPLIPIINRAQYVRSIFVDRVVDATKAASDARLTDVTDHGQGCWSIFAAKIITCEANARRIAGAIALG
jgi:glycine/D-amino acid oxidase-like deaminating enzyme